MRCLKIFSNHTCSLKIFHQSSFKRVTLSSDPTLLSSNPFITLYSHPIFHPAFSPHSLTTLPPPLAPLQSPPLSPTRPVQLSHQILSPHHPTLLPLSLTLFSNHTPSPTYTTPVFPLSLHSPHPTLSSHHFLSSLSPLSLTLLLPQSLQNLSPLFYPSHATLSTLSPLSLHSLIPFILLPPLTSLSYLSFSHLSLIRHGHDYLKM